MVSISVRNNSNASYYYREGRRSSLLIHPHGLKLLENYKQEKNSPICPKDTALSDAIASSLATVIRAKEVEISTSLRKVLKDSWADASGGKFYVTGEKEESVQGVLDHARASGDPDVVIRMLTPSEPSSNVEQKKLVMMIIEVSVDKSGGEKKIGQAFDYSCLIEHCNGTVLLLTLNVDRTRAGGMKITQEAFIYLHSSEESERKMGFLWREVYEAGDKTDLDLLKNSCGGIVRCLNCTECLRIIPSTANEAVPETQWNMVSDNVVVQDDKFVFKIFDNRFHPTFRKPNVWLEKRHRWIANLNVEKHLEFNESESLDVLGKPTRKRERDSDPPTNVAYPRGSVVVIKYKFVAGTHFASKVSHFQQVARCITSMHEADIVHGDIRGFNMLHPHPSPNTVSDAITRSCLIDFDLCGKPGVDKYPPGYASKVDDNVFARSGKQCQSMEKFHDWRELSSVMAHYSIPLDSIATLQEFKDKQKAWETLVNLLDVENVAKDADFAASIDTFIREDGDADIQLPNTLKRLWSNLLKGTGSPNKKQQRSWGSATIDRS